MNQEKYAIIDIGSNTMRLVIYLRENSGRLKEIENVKVVARLRNYLSDVEILTDKGIEILIETLQSFSEVTKHHNLEDVKCVATATVRQAKNKDEIVKKVEKESGLIIRVLSEYEEAYFGYLAVVNTTPFDSGITIDIGGGSTEVTYFAKRELLNYHSFPFGALSLKKQFIRGDIPTDEELEELKAFLLKQFQTLEWLKNKKMPIIAIGGSARNLVQIHQEYIGYPIAGVHQYMMSYQDISNVDQYLHTLSFSELQRVEGLSKDRADIIIPAIEVFKNVMNIVNTDQFALSRKGLRDGVFFEELTKDIGISIFPNVIEESFYELATDYTIDLNHVFHVSNCALNISQLLNEIGLASINREDSFLLKRAAFVYNVGSYIDTEASSQHTFYLLANRTIDGLLHKDRLIIALIASYTSKAGFKRYVNPYLDWFTKDELAKYRLLGAIVKLANSLNATRRNIIKNISIKNEKDELVFDITCYKDWKPEQYQVEKQKKHLEKLLKKSITVHFQSE
ncbi:exopolyphosphatase/guanosine-5'-triphosphate,3'-diphosphate pyrophosphatase [Metabacillus crassostreae]|uniref:exopolyphosphatase n=1 Tax=Metabacillus crassostreae TaxID=929098 RepID=UPI00195F2114|nr:exopolyphosphatase/guanosine-5'-triphosphate,3'-diphosphate pyrophosphatase [Metabacillus crassostreae]